MILISLIILLCVSAARGQQDALVTTQQGVVRGAWSADGSYSMYLGIPYALVNSDNPFGDSLEAPVFDGIFEADDDGAICPQVEEFNNTLVGSLNCLHVNVYVPSSASAANPLAVMVYIYGGGYSIGFAGRYVQGPQYLVRHDVVLVTLNYRLGPYGFMCLGTSSVPGNAGLKDQRKALRWVNDNIAAFGGDVNRITVFGNSAGAMSVEHHILSLESNALFHQAILQSGSIYAGLVDQGRNTAAIELAALFGFTAESSDDAITFLKDISTDEIIEVSLGTGLFFGPCIEQVFNGVESIITESPQITLENGQFSNKPLIVGYTDEENLLWHLLQKDNPSHFESIQDIVFNQLNSRYTFESEEKARRVATFVQQFYFNTEPISADNIFDLINFHSDYTFNYPIEKDVKTHIALGATVYQYIFGYSGDINFSKFRFNVTEGGAAHADEIAFLFKQAYLPDVNTPEDQLVIDRMTMMWANFAKFGDPTPEVTELLPTRWPAANANREYIWLDSDITVDRKPLNRRVAVWDLVDQAYSGN